MSDVDPMDLATQARGQRKSVRRLARLVRRSLALVWAAARGPFAGLVGLQLLNAAALALQVLAVQLTLQAILGVADRSAAVAGLVLPLVLLAGLTALTAVAGSVQGALGRFVGESVVAVMWRRVLDVATAVDLRQFESAEFFDRLQRVQTSALSRPYQVTQGVVTTVGAAAAGGGLTLALVAIHPVLLPLLIVSGLPLLVTSRRASRREFDFTVDQTPAMRLRTYLTFLQTGRDEAKEVRAYGLARNFARRFDSSYAHYLRDLARHLRRTAALGAVGGLGSAAVLGLTLAVLVALIAGGRIDVAEAGAAMVAIRLLAGQVQAVFGGVQSIFESGLFLDDLDRFLVLSARSADEVPGLRPPEPFRTLRAEGVGFRYPGRDEAALADVSITVNTGEVVALVGENGSGKTTLAKVMAGLYAPDDGVVRWDGTDARELDGTLLRDRVAVVFSDFVRYALPARDNIGLGRPDDTVVDADVAAAARTAGADGFLATLPEGYATPLTRLFSGGHELSGGQWQRVALARAFYRQAPLVILDEPSAALDPRAEFELFASLRKTLRGRTALFISHRFATVRTADRIYVLDQGRVVEEGSHDQLMALDGRYAELFNLQASAYASEGPVDSVEGGVQA